jgi:hypothetical protein
MIKEVKISAIEKIGATLKTTTGIVSSVSFLLSAALAVFSYLSLHNTSIKKQAIEDYVKQNKQVNYEIKVDTLVNRMDRVLSSLTLHLADNKQARTEFVSLQNSVKSLALKVAESPLEFARIMEGKTFEIVQYEPIKNVFPDPKIRMRKIPKDSIK